ncbi:MAG: outer membrane protein assembly factor BamE [Halothiobacillaceae bacterium]|nr:MAG: outer membrane protein assembly factor BamE [Halothiobacillaceae bacterium]
MRHARHLMIALAFPLVLTACASSSMPDFLQVYQMDIHQGNILSDENVAKLRIGMPQDEVRFLLGSPMLVDIFHNDRWDYVYYKKAGKGEPEQKRVSLFFENGRLTRIEPSPSAAAP